MRLPLRFRASRVRRSRGAETLEFTLAFIPMMAMVFVLLDVAWAVFAKATLQYAVRTGVRTGITITGAQASAAHSDLTTMVKSIVQKNSLGLLRGSSGLAKIKVHYFQPPASGTTDPAVDVSTKSNGNTPLYIMQVSVENYPLVPFVPRRFKWSEPDATVTNLNAVAADLIEPSRDVPPIGVAP